MYVGLAEGLVVLLGMSVSAGSLQHNGQGLTRCRDRCWQPFPAQPAFIGCERGLGKGSRQHNPHGRNVGFFSTWGDWLLVAASSATLEEEREMSVLKQLGSFSAVLCCLQSSASLNHWGFFNVEERGRQHILLAGRSCRRETAAALRWPT